VRWRRRWGDAFQVHPPGILVTRVRTIADDLDAHGFIRREHVCSLIAWSELDAIEAIFRADRGRRLRNGHTVQNEPGRHGLYDVDVADVIIVRSEENVFDAILLDGDHIALRWITFGLSDRFGIGDFGP